MGMQLRHHHVYYPVIQARQRYEIDMYLKRYSSALSHMIELLMSASSASAAAASATSDSMTAASVFAEPPPEPTEEACFELASTKGLQLQAIAALTGPSWATLRQRLLTSHGTALQEAGKLNEALVTFLSVTPPCWCVTWRVWLSGFPQACVGKVIGKKQSRNSRGRTGGCGCTVANIGVALAC